MNKIRIQHRRFTSRIFQVACAIWILGLSACSGGSSSPSSSSPTATPIPAATLTNASSSSGGWAPSISGAGTANVKGTVSQTQKVQTSHSVGMARLNDPWGSKVTTVDLGTYSASDFGPNGSLTLMAQTVNYPIPGGGYPVLTSFSVVEDGSGIVDEFVNLSSSCASSGAYTCSNGFCDPNPSCAPQANSAFASRTDWDQHQVPAYGYASTNSFPHCDSSLSGWTGCPASLSSLKTGHYYAKYIVLSDSGSTVDADTTDLLVTQVIKKDSSARSTGSTNGAINLNIVLVGSQNISDSHSQKGAQNLNLLLGEVNRILTSNVGVGINSVKAYEWSDANGGSQYSQVNFDNLGVMFAAGSQGVAPQDEGTYINVFLVSDIVYSGANFTILGLSGGILGPPINGTQNSGLAFSSSDLLGTFNSGCTLGSCTRSQQDSDFLEMGATIAHELGHYLGLNHPSEKVVSDPTTQVQDQLSDTPQCAPRTSAGSYVLDQRACYTDTTNTFNASTCQTACDYDIQNNQGIASGKYFAAGNSSYTPNHLCSGVSACQFNHLMWYTTKNRIRDGGGNWIDDGNLISTESSAIVQWDSFVR